MGKLADGAGSGGVKVTLDLAKLLDEGAIRSAEYDWPAQLGRADTGTSLVNGLVGMGVVAVAAGCLLLAPSPIVGRGLGGVLMVAGLALSMRGPAGWAVMANICILVAALLLTVGIALLNQDMISSDGSSVPVMPF